MLRKQVTIAVGLAAAGFVLTLAATSGARLQRPSLRANRPRIVEQGQGGNRLVVEADLARQSWAQSAAAAHDVANSPRSLPIHAAALDAAPPATEPEEETHNDPTPSEPAPAVEVPVAILLRRLTDGAGVELRLRNSSARPLLVRVAFVNPATGAQGELEAAVPARGTRSVGADEGWQVAPGSQVTVRSPPYLDRTLTIQ